MENFTLNFFTCKPIKIMMALMLLCTNIGFAQTTVTYSLGNTSYYTTQTTGTSGAFANGAELGMYSNGGGTKNVVSYRTFKTAGDNTGSTRALQVGDVFSLQVYASAAFGQIGFSLNTTNVTTNYGTRNTNSRLYVQEDGTTGSWYVNSAAGNQSLNYNVSSTYHDYLFKVYITSETTCDVELTVDGGVTQRLFNRTMNGAAGANITGFSLYLSDDYNGSGNANVYWKQVTEVRANTLVNLGYYLTSGTFTPGRITNGLEANSTSTASVNALNIGGDAGTTVILNQPNTYTGATTVNAFARGELQHPQGLGATSGTTVNTNGALSLFSTGSTTYLNYPLTINGFGQNGSNGAIRSVGGVNFWQGAITLGSNSLIQSDISGFLSLQGAINLGANSLTLAGTQLISSSGVISGSGNLVKTGTGSLVFGAGAGNSYTGGTVLQAGAITPANASAFGTGAISFPAGSTATLLDATSMFSNAVSVDATAVATVNTASFTGFSGLVSGSGKIEVTGGGTMQLLGVNTFSGTINVANGGLYAGAGSLATATLNLGSNSAGVDQPSVAILEVGDGTFNNAINVKANAGGFARIFIADNLPATLSGPISLSGSLTLMGQANKTLSGTVSGPAGLIITNGFTTLSGANTYLGNTVVNGFASLVLGSDNTVPGVSNLILNGGSLWTGFGTGHTNVMNILSVAANSNLILGSGSHVLTFSDSSEEIWGGTLTIGGWNGTAGQSNTSGGRIMVGVNGLTSEQLALITFTNRPGTPIILPSGELVPPGPILAVTSGETNHGSSCVGTPATTVTYTITNTGADAFDVDAGSDSEEFVVSNLSSTTIFSGGTATYDVTFTPTIGGTRNAVISIGTATPNSNMPQIAVTGEGITPTAYYADNDLDGYGGGTALLTCDSPPAGYITVNGDCNDTDDAIHPAATEVCDGVDNDCDGLTDGDDPSLDLSTTTAFYADADNDGYGDANAAPVMACVAPVGSVINNDDCDDTNGAVHPGANEICDGLDNDCNGLTDGNDPGLDLSSTTAWYQDNDADGFGAGAPVMACSAPAGTVADNTDCDDAHASAHPGATEIGYNLVDDDCDGFTDEGFAPKVTVVQSAMCSNTLAAIDSQIVANLVAGAQGYRWRITNVNGPNAGQVQTLDTGLRTMKITQLLSYAFNTQYKIEVAVYYAGFLQPYTPSNCTVSTPEVITSLISCNQTLTSMSNSINANLVSYAAGYRFRITDPLNPLNTQVLERPIREFKMTQITNFIVRFGKTYNVEVSVKNTDGTWMSYSSPCQVTTPVFPTTSLQDSQCDNYAVPNNSTQLYATSYPGAISYVFQLSGGGLPAPIEVTKTIRTFTLNDFAGQLTPGATYNVKVRLVFNVSDPAGPYGKTCSITTPGAARQSIPRVGFDAVAYPNPFADNFNIELQTASESDIIVKIYDMLGRLLEEKSVKTDKQSSVQAGENYPSGVYNVIISQGNETKVLRVVKR
jgi:autotransporter-associated beta strand protein